MAAQTKAEIQAELDAAKAKITSLQSFIDDVLDAHTSENVQLVEELDHLESVFVQTIRMIDDLFEAADNSWWVPKSIRNALEPLRRTFIKVPEDEFERFNALEDTLPLHVVDTLSCPDNCSCDDIEWDD